MQSSNQLERVGLNSMATLPFLLYTPHYTTTTHVTVLYSRKFRCFFRQKELSKIPCKHNTVQNGVICDEIRVASPPVAHRLLPTLRRAVYGFIIMIDRAYCTYTIWIESTTARRRVVNNCVIYRYNKRSYSYRMKRDRFRAAISQSVQFGRETRKCGICCNGEWR